MFTVDSASDFPGCCCLTGSSQGPFIRLDRPLGAEFAAGGTAYVSLSVLQEMAVHIGYCPAGAVEEADEQVARLIEERDEAREEHAQLLRAVGYTLQHGAVAKGGAVELRIPGGRKPRKSRAAA